MESARGAGAEGARGLGATDRATLPTKPTRTTTTAATKQVVSEVYATRPVPVEPHVVLALALCKLVDPAPEVREDALHALQVLSAREWRGGGGAGGGAGGDAALEQLLEGWSEAAGGAGGVGAGGGGGGNGVVVLGALQDSYQQFQYQLSAKLARCGAAPAFVLAAPYASPCLCLADSEFAQTTAAAWLDPLLSTPPLTRDGNNTIIIIESINQSTNRQRPPRALRAALRGDDDAPAGARRPRAAAARARVPRAVDGERVDRGAVEGHVVRAAAQGDVLRDAAVSKRG